MCIRDRFWVVWDAEKACTEVEDYYAAVSFLAQTAMREAVGRSTVAEVALRRDQLDIEIKEDIEKEAANWGVEDVYKRQSIHRAWVLTRLFALRQPSAG